MDKIKVAPHSNLTLVKYLSAGYIVLAEWVKVDDETVYHHFVSHRQWYNLSAYEV